MKRLRLLIVHNEYIHRGGEDACVDNEISALRQENIDVIEFRVRNQQTSQSKLRALSAPFGAGDEKKLETLLLQERPDILHAHNLFPLLSPRLFKASQKNGIKTVLTLHNYRPLCLNGLFLTPQNVVCERCSSGNYLPGILRGCYRNNRFQSLGLAAHLWTARVRSWYEAVDAFIAPSHFLKAKFVKNGFPEGKIVVQGHFLPDWPTVDPQVPEPFVLYMGRLSEEKGIRWLLRLFRQPAFAIKLVVAGSGPLQKEIEKACGDTIRYVGFVKNGEKDRYLQRATALIMPSECYENFPLAVAEANAWGTPALVCDQGGMNEMVVPGKNGQRYLLKNNQSFWENLGKIRHCPDPLQLRKECREYAGKQFSKDRFNKDRIAFYNSLISQQRADELAIA